VPAEEIILDAGRDAPYLTRTNSQDLQFLKRRVYMALFVLHIFSERSNDGYFKG